MVTPLDAMFPARHAYVGTVHARSAFWFGLRPAQLAAVSGGVLAIAGTMPVVCHAGVATPRILSLLAAAGHPAPSAIHPVITEEQMMAAARALAADGWRLVIPHAFPPDAWPVEGAWIPWAVATALNDKGLLGDLVPAPLLPDRRVGSPDRLLATVRPPVVLKAATWFPTGGGGDVRLCRTVTDVATAATTFMACEQLVAEEWLPMERSLCANVFVSADGTITDIGVAEQYCSEDGRYLGNWLGDQGPDGARALAVARTVAAAGAARGYYGVVGIDVAVLPDGTLRAFDANFRLNGSTAALLMAQRVGGITGLLRGFVAGSDTAGMLRAVECAMARGLLVPMSVYDADCDPGHGDRSTVRAIVLGETRARVHERVAECAGLGLVAPTA